MTRLFTFLLFLSLSLFPIRVLYAQTSEYSEIQRIDSLINRENYSLALATLEEILFKQPSNLDAQERKITVMVKLDRSKEALDDIEKYIAMYPGKGVFLYLRGLLNLQKEKYSKGIEDFDQALHLELPDEAIYKTYMNRGMSNFYIMELENSSADFNKAIELNPKSAAAYHGAGMVQYAEKEYEGAISFFQKSLKLDESNAITHFNAAMTYFRLEDKDNACYHFNRSCTLGNRNACRLLMMECAEDIKIAK